MFRYIYLIRRREHVRLNENIYKIGLTFQGIKEFNKPEFDYGNGLEINSMLIVDDVIGAKDELKHLFKAKYASVKEQTGDDDCFAGNINEMLLDFKEVAESNKVYHQYYEPNMCQCLR